MRVLPLFLGMYLLLGSFMPRMDFSQYTYFTGLWAHYFHHNSYAHSEEEHHSLTEFIYKHFIDIESHHDTEPGHDHDNLPFQGFNLSIHVFITGASPFEELRETPDGKGLSLYANVFHLKGFPNTIFHPPSHS